ncbi:MAG: CRISPR-associated protein [Syntrophaceae bacterium]|nr:MAG: CRISPR-associated protein [Syntrophaceae bacterium]
MKLYEITIRPDGWFGTPLKGDTVFGHFCWQAAYDPGLLNGGLDKWIAQYPKQPFAVFSSAWPMLSDASSRYAVKKPDIPVSFLFPASKALGRCKQMEERKEKTKLKWMLLAENLSMTLKDAVYKTDRELASLAVGKVASRNRQEKPISYTRDFDQQHNTINRSTMTTGLGIFAPYEQLGMCFIPNAELALFILIDEDATDIERVCTGIERIGKTGFGRDASTGGGRFTACGFKELALPAAKTPDACYVLSPVVPEKGAYAASYFTPFVRFGKHGDTLARSVNPFKNPVIMADEGAVFMPKEKNGFAKPYMGRAITGVSKSDERTVVQGYAVYLPFRLEVER